MGVLAKTPSGAKWVSFGFGIKNVSILRGVTSNGQEQFAPVVCFHMDGCVSDDAVWFRPVPATVMEFCQPEWKQWIREKYSHDADKCKKAKNHYRLVLKWSKDMLSTPKLDPATIPGCKVLTRKLKSFRINPEIVPRQPKGGGAPAAKPASAIAKGAKSVAAPQSVAAATSSNSDDADVEMEAVDAKTVLLGPEASVATFVKGGLVYATVLA